MAMMERVRKIKQDAASSDPCQYRQSILRMIDRVITTTHFRHNAHLKGSHPLWCRQDTSARTLPEGR